MCPTDFSPADKLGRTSFDVSRRQPTNERYSYNRYISPRVHHKTVLAKQTILEWNTRTTSSYKGQANYSTVQIACEQSCMVEET